MNTIIDKRLAFANPGEAILHVLVHCPGSSVRHDPEQDNLLMKGFVLDHPEANAQFTLQRVGVRYQWGLDRPLT